MILPHPFGATGLLMRDDAVIDMVSYRCRRAQLLTMRPGSLSAAITNDAPANAAPTTDRAIFPLGLFGVLSPCHTAGQAATVFLVVYFSVHQEGL